MLQFKLDNHRENGHMALRPQDLALTQAEIKRADQLEKLNDQHLKNRFFSDAQSIIFSFNRQDTFRVMREVLRRYKLVGWDFELKESDPSVRFILPKNL